MLWRLEDEMEPVEAITMAKIGEQLMYPPLFIINALSRGVTLGILEHDYKTDVLKVTGDAPESFMGTEILRIKQALLERVRQVSGKKEDLSLGLIQQWGTGVRPSAVQLALRVLMDEGTIVEYTLTDPVDEDSRYEFYTLAENAQKQWGKKQFTAKKGKK
jgi:hypothetical protein